MSAPHSLNRIEGYVQTVPTLWLPAAAASCEAAPVVISSDTKGGWQSAPPLRKGRGQAVPPLSILADSQRKLLPDAIGGSIHVGGRP